MIASHQSIFQIMTLRANINWSSAFIVLFTVFFSALPVSAEADKTHNVLLINSYNQNMTWVKDIIQAVNDELKPDGTRLILHVENMDSKVYSSDAYLKALPDLYAEKYRGVTFDLVLSSDNNAFNLLRRSHNSVFPGVPIVFCGVNYFKPNQIIDHPEFTGVAETFSDVETIKTILKLHPKAQEIFIVNDYTSTGKAWTETMRENIAATGLDKQVKISFAENLSLQKMQILLGELDENAIILLGVYFKDKEGDHSSYEEIGKKLLKNTKRPAYALLNFNVSEKVIGGKVINGYSQGMAAAKIGLQILSGTAPIDIPVMTDEETNHYIFNWPQLNTWNINPDLLPEGSWFVNHPPSFYDQNKTLVWSVASLFALLTLALSVLSWLSYLQKVTNRRLEKKVAVRTKEISMQTRMLEDVGRLSMTGGWELDISTMCLKWSKETYRLYEAPESYELNVDEVIKFYTVEGQPIMTAAIESAINNSTPFDLELPLITAKGRSIWVRTLGEVIYRDGKPETLIGAIQDISEHKRMEDKLKVLATTDDLTSLYNRFHFNSKLEDELQRAIRFNTPLSLLMLDIDYFKKINDTYGHPAGDACLVALAHLISDLSRTVDTCARYGGEEFVIILPQTPAENAMELAERLRQKAEALVIQYDDQAIQCTVSIGISALSIAQEKTAEAFLKTVDSSLYKAKEGGRNCVVSYSAGDTST